MLLSAHCGLSAAALILFYRKQKSALGQRLKFEKFILPDFAQLDWRFVLAMSLFNDLIDKSTYFLFFPYFPSTRLLAHSLLGLLLVFAILSKIKSWRPAWGLAERNLIVFLMGLHLLLDWLDISYFCTLFFPLCDGHFELGAVLENRWDYWTLIFLRWKERPFTLLCEIAGLLCLLLLTYQAWRNFKASCEKENAQKLTFLATLKKFVLIFLKQGNWSKSLK